ncbi:hypothetical protein BSIN_2757 [Burkholderia singularis]|uniref:Uncharacterized protein n=1 Tax=Burkholderia singularis TaxID=1503053 RepID=A0A238H2V8_9BURK|nr:hypothetical protein BSIN_2757 [Burkholderia singularis]
MSIKRIGFTTAFAHGRAHDFPAGRAFGRPHAMSGARGQFGMP